MTDHSKPFWKVAKLLKKRPTPVPPLKVNGALLVSPQEKVNAIAGKLVEAHHHGAGMVSPHEAAVQQSMRELDDLTNAVPFPGRITENELRAAVKSGRNMKAPGEDGIFNLVLKKLTGKAYRVLAAVFTRCLQLSYFPTRWKMGKVIPILKPGKDPTQPSSYRPPVSGQ